MAPAWQARAAPHSMSTAMRAARGLQDGASTAEAQYAPCTVEGLPAATAAQAQSAMTVPHTRV